MQKTPLYKRCLPALALILALMLPLVSLAEVSKVVQGGALNMRAEPSLSAQVLRQYPTGTWMTVLEDMGEWSKVRVNGLEGYVMSKYLSDTSSDSTLYVRTNTGRGLNLRDLPSLEGNIITSFKPGTAVTVLLRGNGWYKVSVQGMTGYMASQYLSASSSSGGGSSTSGYPKTGVVNNPGANQVLLLRETASTDARVLGYYRNGTSVQLLGESGSFYKVTVGGKNGYMMKKFIKVTGSTSGGGSSTLPQTPFTAKLVNPNGNWPSPNAAPGLPVNEWIHIAVVWDATTGERIYYQNGEVVASDNAASGSVSLNSGCYVGRSYDDSRWLPGEISELRIWNIQRTQEQIASSMYTVDPTTPGLLAYWKFNEGSGNVINDATGNGTNLTGEGTPTWVNVELPE